MIARVMEISTPYYTKLAAAFVRGKLHDQDLQVAHPELFQLPVDGLSTEEQDELIRLGQDHGLRLHRFKRTLELPRVHHVLGILKGIQPSSLLDIGSGRGVFLWPLLDAFPQLPVTCADLLDYRVADIQAVHDGGITQVRALQADATELPFADQSFEVVTMLEVLEHIPATARALTEVCRVASRFVILSVPSKADDNPEHIHLFDERSLNTYLQTAGITRVSTTYVLNHMIVLARMATS